MPRNRSRPSLLRTAARAAVVSSAVTAASQATSNRMSARAQSQTGAIDPPTEAAAAPADWVAQLAQLAQLRDSGALTDAEFQQAKASLMPPS
ncbi:MAG: SHOCT domain-containing protein [Nodosilinea sp.]|jgi:membrane protease subunit (stomatin/prohibitin family)